MYSLRFYFEIKSYDLFLSLYIVKKVKFATVELSIIFLSLRIERLSPKANTLPIRLIGQSIY